MLLKDKNFIISATSRHVSLKFSFQPVKQPILSQNFSNIFF